MDRVYDSVDDDIDSVGVGGANIISELLVEIRDLEGEEATLRREDQGLGRMVPR